MSTIEEEVHEIARLRRLVVQHQAAMNESAWESQDRIYRATVEHGVSQKQLADLLGVSPNVVHQAIDTARKRPLRTLKFDSPLVQGRWAKELRVRSRRDLADIADELGTTPQWIKAVEYGNPMGSADLLPRLFQLYGVSPSSLIMTN